MGGIQVRGLVKVRDAKQGTQGVGYNGFKGMIKS
jgi:hypothetical protein